MWFKSRRKHQLIELNQSAVPDTTHLSTAPHKGIYIIYQTSLQLAYACLVAVFTEASVALRFLILQGFQGSSSFCKAASGSSPDPVLTMQKSLKIARKIAHSGRSTTEFLIP